MRIKAKDSSVNMNAITRQSGNSDYDIIPVARSYNSRNWERVAGPYAQDLSITGCCTLVLPSILSNLEEGEGTKFLLMSFTHSLTNQEIVSRFYQQTTFGPTMDMITSWNYNTNMDLQKNRW